MKKIIQLKKLKRNLIIYIKKLKETEIIFILQKILAVLESLEHDGVTIPKEINHKDLSKSYLIPDSLNDLAEKGEKGYLALKIVEIIGEDEVNNLILRQFIL